MRFLILCISFIVLRQSESRITSISKWGKYKCQTVYACFNTYTGLSYNTLYIGYLKKNDCFSMCESLQECSSVLYEKGTETFAKCTLANSVTGCSSQDTIWYRKVII